MASKPVHVDYGNTESEFQFRFDTKGMKAGDHARVHFTGDEFIDHVGITSADLFNPTGAEITTNAVGSQFGISAFHGEDGGIPGPTGNWIRTANRVPIKGSSSEGVQISSEHQHVTMPHMSHKSTLKLRPTADQMNGRAKANNRKGIATWAGMTPKNVTAGVFVSKLGDKKKYVVPEKDAEGTTNAIFKYITKNSRKKDFMGGKYFGTRAKMTNHNGAQAYVIEDADHFDAMNKVLTDLVTTHSPYQHGFGVSAVKLDDTVDDKPLVVSVKFKRNPVSTKEGFQGLDTDDAVTENQLRSLVNGGPVDDDVVTSTGEVFTVPGFEEELRSMSAKNIDEVVGTHSFEPYDASA